MATVESAFVLIDRASGPTRRIRTELRKTRLEAERTGRALDDMAGPRMARQLEGLADETDGVRRETRGLRTDLGATGREMAAYERRVRGAARETRSFAQGIRDVQTVMGLLKWPVMIAGAGGATQAIGGLAGGLVALAPKLTDVGGAAVGAGNLLVGAGAAAGVAKLAFQDVGDAIDGNREAIKRLTPEGRAFVQMVREMRPEVREWQREAQRGLFPGVGDLLGEARAQSGGVRAIVRQTSRDLGGLASWTARQVGTPDFMRDLAETSDIGARALGSAARSGFQMARAAQHILIAGGPLTDWLGETIEGWAETAVKEAEVARKTGELDRWFDQVQDTLEDLGDTVGHVWGGIAGTLDAARGQSEDLYDSINEGAERWDDWANSFHGQNEMRRWFDDVRPALDATVGLVGDLARGVADLSRGPQGAAMIERLREAGPEVAAGVEALTENLGPAAIDALAEGAELLGTLAGQSGPLTLVAEALGTTADALNKVIDALGPLGPEVAGLLATALVLQRLGVLGGRGGRGGGAGGAGALLAGAGAGALLGRGRRSGGGLSPAELAAVGGGAGALAMARAGLGQFRGDVASRYGFARHLGYGRAGAATTALGGASRMAGFGGMAGSGLGALGRVALPLWIANGVISGLGTQGGVWDKVEGGASALSMGVIPRPITDAERRTAGGAYAGDVMDRLSREDALAPRGGGGLAHQRSAIADLRTQIRLLPGNDAFDQNKADLDKATELLRIELKRRRQLLRESEQQVRDDLRAKSIEHAEALSRDFAGAFRVRARGPEGPEGAMERMTAGMLGKLRDLKPAGREVLGENMLAWAQQQADENPALLDEVEALEAGIKRSFRRTGRDVAIVNGNILTGSKREWAQIRAAIVTETEKARQEATDNFTALQRQAIGALTAMGFSPSQARGLVQNAEDGSRAARRTLRNPQRAATSGASGMDRVAPSDLDRAATGDGIGIGDGLGNATMGGPPAASVYLDGADPGLARYAALGAKHGLRVSSGLRPGAVTSSGNPSYHGTGDALDVAGSPAGMMAFAQEVASLYGSGLEELIYSPLGWGIKGGQRVPLSYFGPEVIADHYDHVHVADVDPAGVGGLSALLSMDTAGPGLMSISLDAPGSSLGGVPGALAGAASEMYAAGLEQTINEALGAGGAMFAGPGGGGSAAALREQFGLPAIFDQIRFAESRHDPNARNPSGASGLYQIMMPLHAELVARVAAGLGRPADVFDPVVNTAVAAELYRQAGLSPWAASQHAWGDGVGAEPVARAVLRSAGRPAVIRAGGGQAGGNVFHFSPTAQISGMDRATMRAELVRHLDAFVDMVFEEIESGAEQPAAGVM